MTDSDMCRYDKTTVTFQLTRELKTLAVEAARTRGLTLSEYLRSLVQRDLGLGLFRDTVDPKDRLRDA